MNVLLRDLRTEASQVKGVGPKERQIYMLPIFFLEL
jgi:hypothetical protein